VQRDRTRDHVTAGRRRAQAHGKARAAAECPKIGGEAAEDPDIGDGPEQQHDQAALEQVLRQFEVLEGLPIGFGPDQDRAAEQHEPGRERDEAAAQFEVRNRRSIQIRLRMARVGCSRRCRFRAGRSRGGGGGARSPCRARGSGADVLLKFFLVVIHQWGMNLRHGRLLQMCGEQALLAAIVRRKRT
jgi:hypothetical protein